MPAKRRTGPELKENEKTINPVARQKELRIVLEKVDESKEMQRMTRASKRKAEQTATTDENSEQAEPNVPTPTTAAPAEAMHAEKDVKPVLTTLAPNESSDATTIVKNTDSAYTVKASKCLLCNKNIQYLSTHYTNHHDTYEVYSARMSSKKASQLRRNPAKSAIRADGKIQAHCYYCENDVNLNRNKWVDHLIRHTGEYTRHCKKCGCIVTSTSDRSKCSHPDPVYKAIVEFTDTLYVYMCNYCNYTQSQEENVQKHIRNMHEIQFNVMSQYQKITLIPNFAPRSRAAARAISTDGSESGSSVSNASAPTPAAINIEAFMPTQNEDEINNAKRLLESTTNDSADTNAPLKRGSAGQSIIDRLKARFDMENPIKEETGAVEHVEPSIVYRAPDEMCENAKRTTTVAGPSSTSSLNHGSVIEDQYKIELNKTEVGHEADAAAVINDDGQSDDDDQSWESLSSEGEDEDDTSTPNNQISRLIQSKGIPKTNNKTVRSRQQQQQKKRPIGLSSMVCKAEKSDDAVNNIAVEQQQKSPKKSSPKAKRPSLSKEDALRVDNIAWNDCLGEQKYYCYIGNCGFISHNNLDSLSNHLRQKHSNHPWTGYCHKCDQQILNNNRCSLMKEFDHLKTHIPEKVLTPPKPSTSATVQPPPQTQKATESSPSLTAAQILAKNLTKTPETPSVPPPQSRPILQLRPLAELLKNPSNVASPSTAPMQLQPIQLQPMPSQPSLVISNVSSLRNPNPVELGNSVSGVTVSLASDNPLKPWTTCTNKKSPYAETKLKRECSLMALFKCMANDCIFTTSDKGKMLKHLENHEDQAADSFNAQILDDGSWFECCYCEENLGSCGLLVQHIIEEHSTSIFQCPQCFYRSVDLRNIFLHLEKHHKINKDGSLIPSVLICGAEMKDFRIDINALIQARANVQEFECPESGKSMEWKINLNSIEIN